MMSVTDTQQSQVKIMSSHMTGHSQEQGSKKAGIIMSDTNTIETTSTETTAAPVASALTIDIFMTRANSFLNERCVPGTAAAVSRAEVAKAGGLSEDSDSLISDLINAGFMPGWKIRQGRDGGVCRVGEETSKGPNPNKYAGEWLCHLIDTLNKCVSLNSKVAVTRNDIARELAKVTGEDVLSLPNKISEAISLGKCPGFESKRGSGIFRKPVAVVEALAVSADATTTDVADVVAAPTVTVLTDEVLKEQALAQDVLPETALSDAALVESVVLETSLTETVLAEMAEAVKDEPALTEAVLTEAVLTDAVLTDAGLSEIVISEAGLSDTSISEILAPVEMQEEVKAESDASESSDSDDDTNTAPETQPAAPKARGRRARA